MASNTQSSGAVLNFTEEPPTWWVKGSNMPFRAIWLGVICIVGGMLTGTTWLFFVGVLVAIVCLGIGVAGKMRETTFPASVRLDANGEVTLTREYKRVHGKGDTGTVRFYASQVVAVERVTYAQEYPDAMAAMQQINDPDLSKARSIEVVQLTFDDGQQIDALWFSTGNKAAVAQTGIRKLLAQGQTPASAPVISPASRLDPDDEPL